jgi:hypothetical protein
MIRRPTAAVHNGDLNKMPQHRRVGLLALVRASQSINRRRIGPLPGLGNGSNGMWENSSHKNYCDWTHSGN